MTEIENEKVPEKPKKKLIISEDGEMEWVGFEDEYQQLGFLQIRFNPQAVQAVAAQLVRAHHARTKLKKDAKEKPES